MKKVFLLFSIALMAFCCAPAHAVPQLTSGYSQTAELFSSIDSTYCQATATCREDSEDSPLMPSTIGAGSSDAIAFLETLRTHKPVKIGLISNPQGFGGVLAHAGKVAAL